MLAILPACSEKKWPEFEKLIHDEKNYQTYEDFWGAYQYISHYNYKRDFKFEDILVKAKINVKHVILLYATNMLPMYQRWFDAEELLSEDLFSSNLYCTHMGMSLQYFQEELIRKNNFNIRKIDGLHPELKVKYHHLLVSKDIGII